jgi:hypothetical protein
VPIDQVARRMSLKAEAAAYSLVTTTLVILLAIGLAKVSIDKSRILWLAQERHEALLDQDRQSRRFAHEAIRKHNAHMEKCNRVVEREMAAERELQRPTTAIGSQPEEQLLKQADVERERAALETKLESPEDCRPRAIQRCRRLPSLLYRAHDRFGV